MIHWIVAITVEQFILSLRHTAPTGAKEIWPRTNATPSNITGQQPETATIFATDTVYVHKIFHQSNFRDKKYWNWVSEFGGIFDRKIWTIACPQSSRMNAYTFLSLNEILFRYKGAKRCADPVGTHGCICDYVPMERR